MTLTDLRAQMFADLALARQQGWRVEALNKHTVRLTRGERELLVDGTKSGGSSRKALRRELAP